MSSHRRVKHFSRKSNARTALFRGLVTSLVEHGRITTTVDKAKETRRHVEKAITLGKKGDLATRRLLLARYPNQAAVEKIMTDISPRFKSRNGGYTRIIKIGRRPGDTAEMAFIEFVDYDYNAKAEGSAPAVTKSAKKSKKAAATEEAPAKKATSEKKASKSLVVAKKKAVKKIQKQSRAASRG